MNLLLIALGLISLYAAFWNYGQTKRLLQTGIITDGKVISVAKNIDTANTLSRNLRSGTVWINCFNNFDAALPFGGFKGSGFGRDKGYSALEAYTEVKTIQTPLFDAHWR